MESYGSHLLTQVWTVKLLVTWSGIVVTPTRDQSHTGSQGDRSGRGKGIFPLDVREAAVVSPCISGYDDRLSFQNVFPSHKIFLEIVSMFS